MKLLFFGTPQFAVPTLEMLVAEKFAIELVVTNPDEPRGRGYAIQPSPVKQVAERFDLALFQPAKLKDPGVRERLSQFHPDAAVVVAYGHILPTWLIEIPKLGCINLHASLLPKYRGAAPIPWAIIHGEKKTGVTTMKIDAGMDTGDILLVRETEIHDGDTRPSLEERLSVMGAELMTETLRGLERGVIVPRAQDSSQSSVAPMLKKADGKINWNWPAEEIARRVRGVNPWPGAFSAFRGRAVQIRAARAAEISAFPPATGSPGGLAAMEGKLLVFCGDGRFLDIVELQPEGKKRMTAREFINGARLKPGERFES